MLYKLLYIAFNVMYNKRETKKNKNISRDMRIFLNSGDKEKTQKFNYRDKIYKYNTYRHCQ